MVNVTPYAVSAGASSTLLGSSISVRQAHVSNQGFQCCSQGCCGQDLFLSWHHRLVIHSLNICNPVPSQLFPGAGGGKRDTGTVHLQEAIRQGFTTLMTGLSQMLQMLLLEFVGQKSMLDLCQVQTSNQPYWLGQMFLLSIVLRGDMSLPQADENTHGR